MGDIQGGFAACGLANTLLSACVWRIVAVGGAHYVEVAWGALRGRKEEEAQKEPDVSNLSIWLNNEVINPYVKSKR